MGRLIPAGTGFDFYRKVRIEPDEPPPLPPLSSEELELAREMEYFVDPSDGAAGRLGAPGALEPMAQPDGLADPGSPLSASARPLGSPGKSGE